MRVYLKLLHLLALAQPKEAETVYKRKTHKVKEY